jgi:hypothetical protein
MDRSPAHEVQAAESPRKRVNSLPFKRLLVQRWSVVGVELYEIVVAVHQEKQDFEKCFRIIERRA